MTPERFRVTVRDDVVTALRYAAERPRATLVLAHGAGAGQSHPFMVAFARGLAARRIDVITFDFVYTSSGRRRPDRNDALEACWRSVLDAARSHTRGALVIGGKSMGGRIATQVAAGEDVRAAGDVVGVVLLGYPLHPPAKPTQLRVEHLPRVRAPMLFCQGTRDPFGGPDELAPYLEGTARGTRVLAVEGGDHSFAVPKRQGVLQDEVYARVMDEIVQWIAARVEGGARASSRRRARPGRQTDVERQAGVAHTARATRRNRAHRG